MNYIKKYGIIIFLWIIAITITILYWGTGRLFILISAFISSIGYYLVLKAKEGKEFFSNYIDINKEGIKNGFARVEGSIKAKDELYSYINEDRVVFYEVVVEMGKFDYSNLNLYGADEQPQVINNKFTNAKWSIVNRKDKWSDFYISMDSDKKILVKNPEKAEGKWIFDTKELPQLQIKPLEEAEDKIQELVEKSKKRVENGRYIRYMERTIRDGSDVIVYGTVKNNEEGEYYISKGDNRFYLITNDKSDDFLYEEKKHYLRGMIIFILGLIGMIISFVWPILTDIAYKTQI